ncbi:hypothetical protein PInf_004158 [Phytophthora infestans]|nr:hypothetical protein PInf_004158 [Phytophthora infestans]
MLYEQDAVIPNAEGSENSVDIQTTLLSVTIQTRNLATNHFVARTRPNIVLFIIVELLIYPKSAIGKIDADEVADMLENIFGQTSAVTQRKIHKHVEEFIRVVDKDTSRLVSFKDFVEALKNDPQLAMVVYTRHKPMTSTLAARREHVLAAFNENGGDSEDVSESDEPKVVNVGSGDKIQPKLPRRNRSPYQASSVEKGKIVWSAASSAPAMCRDHDVLNVEEFTSSDIAAQMKTADVEWLLEEHRYEKSLVQAVEERRFATLEDAVANELQDPGCGVDGQGHVQTVYVHGLGTLDNEVVGKYETDGYDGDFQYASTTQR